MAYSIAICDDESLFCQKICEYLDAYQDETGIELEISHFNTGLDLLEHINNHNLYHIIILDVELDFSYRELCILHPQAIHQFN